jgi:2',3'-cyclic-nucleotide 2'-phosphodiesterase (5'-nucleotidase family)
MIQGERAGAKDSALLVLDAGDSLVGDREPAMRTQGATSVEAMNRMGYDAMVLGPADLSLGPDLVRRRISEARFAVLAADVTDATTKATVGKPYVIKDAAGHRVAIIGLSGAPSKNGFEIADGQQTVRRVLQELAGQADAVVLLSHASPDVNQRIADEIPGITAIIEGGAASRSAPWVSKTTGTPIYHADAPSSGHAGRVMGVADLKVAAGKLETQAWQAVSLGSEIADDAAMAAWIPKVY